MKVYHFPEGPGTAQYLMLMSDLLEAPVVHTGDWQAMDVSASPAHATHELEDVTLRWDRMPSNLDEIFPAIDFDWANEHFGERVSGVPYNPAPSHVRWPYAVRGNAMHTDAAARFDHTYPERFWPKHAACNHDPDQWTTYTDERNCGGTLGVRFHYGDLEDVVSLLIKKPLTRQAFLPVWFPEDTGATEGQRVPCTIGYHFMQRGGRLSCRYYIRSCDAYRHLSNDVWLAAMLTDWVARQVTNLTKGEIRFRNGGLTMHISSLHSFVGDRAKVKARIEEVSNAAA